MLIKIQRDHQTVDGMFGMLNLDTNPFTAFTVENLEKMIGAGLYDVKLDWSPHLNMITPHLAVPVRDEEADGDAGIRLHIANYPNQLEGCIAVGNKDEPDAVDASRVTFMALMKILTAATDPIQIEISDIPVVTDGITA